jgi:Delta7-sterol 5-desaturase
MEYSLSVLTTIAQSFTMTYLAVFPGDFLRYLMGAGGVYLIVNMLLAKALAGRKIRDKSPDSAQMTREFWASIRTVAIFAFVGSCTVLAVQAGYIHIDAGLGARGWGYFFFNVAALIVLHDAWFYWTHRLIHRPRLFRRFHREHHKSHNPSPWTAYSFDIGEAFINAIYMPLAVTLIASSGPAIFVFLVHMMLRNAIGHCGYELMPSWRNGRPMFDWMTSVTHHDLHHAQAGWNYGLYFTWWDRLMQTEHPLYHEKFAAAVGKPLDGSAVRAIGQSRAYLITAVGFIAASLCTLLGMGESLAHESILALSQLETMIAN